MSNFPGDLFAYNNPLISIYNPHTHSLTPAVPGGDLVPWKSSTSTFGITLPMRIRTFHTIGEALKKPIMGEYLYEGDWGFNTPAQYDFKFFISRYHPYHSVEENTKLKISTDYNKINHFFAKHGSNARITSFDNMSGYGVGILSQMTYGWMFPAQSASIGRYKGIEFTAGYEILESKDNFHLPLIRIRTNQPNITAVIKMDNPQYKNSDPYQPIFNFLNYRRDRHFYRPITRNYTALQIPQIKTEIDEDVDHLNGMCLQKYNKKTGMFQAFTINTIKQQTLVNINPTGVNIGSNLSVKSTTGNMKEGYTRPVFEINKPFLFWLEHDWIPSYPLFIGFFNREAWIPEK